MHWYKGVCVECPDGVYPPGEDTFLLIDSMKPEGDVLDVGTGTGMVAIHAAKRGCKVDACDINPLAVRCALKNAERNMVYMNVYKSDLFREVHGMYDTILFNAPYLPYPNEDPSWSGGMEIINRFFLEMKEHLKGRAYIVYSSLTGDVAGAAAEFGYSLHVLKEEAYLFERLYCAEVTL